MRKLILTTAVIALLSGCGHKQYSIEKESFKVVDETPGWYVDPIKDRKCKGCLFGVGTAVSPDLQLSKDKARLIAKAELADVIKGEMNAKAKLYITELGRNQKMDTVTEVESTIVNVISQTKVRGYELWKQEITLTKNGMYRTFIGLKLPVGDANKLYEYAIEEVADAFNVKQKADKAFSEVELQAIDNTKTN
tara:strand:- start:14 stop:592 length:579 start_codon:yes stop_codon:yes gene_type:complete